MPDDRLKPRAHATPLRAIPQGRGVTRRVTSRRQPATVAEPLQSHVIEAARRHLLRAANAWRERRGHPPLHEGAPVPASPPRQTPSGQRASLPIAPVVARRTGRPDAAREIAAIGTLRADPAAVCRAYERRFGRIYNADNMSELFDVHGAERWEHHDAVRSSASAATQFALDCAVHRPPGKGDRLVVFSAGGNGSGKSTAVANLPVGFGLDSTLSDDRVSRANVDRVLASGRRLLILFVFRDPVDAFLHGVLVRMLDPLNGRPVPLATHAATHAGAPRTLMALADDYDGHPAVDVAVIDNTTGEVPVIRDPAWLRSRATPQADAIRRSLEVALRAERDDGRVPDAIARRVRGG